MADRITIHEMNMKSLNNRKKIIRVCLPSDYDTSNESYPVLYMHDGQNLNDPSSYSDYSWDIQRTLDHLQNQKIISGIIVVGIDADSKYRILEYSQELSQKAKKYLQKSMAQEEIKSEGKEYAKFIVQDLKPFIDKNYRTLPQREFTGMAGSSCGGNISLYMGTQYDTIFSVIGAFSPAYWIVKQDLFSLIKQKNYFQPMMIYFDMGTKEGAFGCFTYLKDTKQMKQLFQDKKLNSINFKMVIEKKATHTELFWQSRFPEFVKWGFKKVK
ncbi:MAG: alpha/beta hydrolase [Firmicutes bacterium]|nr:alpha/beta hydrolase [Bacillota bacterium]